MKYRLFLLVLLVISLNCPKRGTPDIDRIEVLYLSSLYDDIQQEEPLLAGIKDAKGIVLAHLITDPPFTAVLLGKLGFFDLLSQTGLDYLIVDRKTTRLDNVSYFVVPFDLGYVISNYEGIRFAILSKHKDSLTIEDLVTVEIVRQRSDIIWIIDSAFVSTPPMIYRFHIKDRSLADTSVAVFQPTLDSVLLQQVHACAKALNDIFEKTIIIDENLLSTFTLNRVAQNENVNIVLYDPALFINDLDKDILRVKDFIKAVACEQQFQTTTMTREQATALKNEHGYIQWGTLNATNSVLYPAKHGKYLFDLLSLVDIPQKY